MQGVYGACVMLHILEMVVPPPPRYPDIFPVLNVLISTPIFVLVWLWSIKCSIELGWALGGLSESPSSIPKNGNGTAIPISMSNSERATQGSRVDGIGREMGARAMSLGYAQGRKRTAYRPASIGPDA